MRLPACIAGFPANDGWDDHSETRCAVKPLKSPVWTAFCHNLTNEPCRVKDETGLHPVNGEKDHWQVEDRAHYYREKVALRTPDEVKRRSQFYPDFEAWRIDVRQNTYTRNSYSDKNRLHGFPGILSDKDSEAKKHKNQVGPS